MWTFVTSTVWCPAACTIYGTLFTDWHGAHYIYYSSTICIVTGTKKSEITERWDWYMPLPHCTPHHNKSQTLSQPCHDSGSHQPLTMGAWVQSQSSSGAIFYGQSGTRFSSQYFIFTLSFHQCSTLTHSFTTKAIYFQQVKGSLTIHFSFSCYLMFSLVYGMTHLFYY